MNFHTIICSSTSTSSDDKYISSLKYKTKIKSINQKEKDEVFSHYRYDFSEEKIYECVNSCGFKPNKKYLKIISENIKKIKVEERAMFLAQIIHESAGLTAIEEIAYLEGGGCADSYKDDVGLPGKDYHGRGFIQLTWGANYKAASESLGLGDQLLQEPELVCNDLNIAWGVTEYFWNTNVSTHHLVQQKMFWATTFCINGVLECKPDIVNKNAELRWQYYEIISKVMGEKNKAQRGLEELNIAILNERKLKDIKLRSFNKEEENINKPPTSNDSEEENINKFE